MFVKPMKAGVTCTVLMDCCHSGTVLDLPYRFSADDSKMRIEKGFNVDALMGVQAVMCCACLALTILDAMNN